MLELIDVKKDYVSASQTVHALKGIHLQFRRNEFVSILGASGCGKTTLLNIIGGLDHYTDGDLIINGKSTKTYNDHDWDVYRNHRIGFVFQSYNLIPHQTVLGNVEIALTIAGVSKAERKARAEEALKKVGLEGELHKRPNQLSGGQMQRVAIARALVNNPEILLADEPTGALDTETSIQIMELIREIAGERLVIMVTHNPELAEEYSSRIVRLSDGLVVSDSNPFDGEEEENEVPMAALKEERTEENFAASEEEKGEKPRKKKNGKKKKERSSMSFKASLGLSARNLAMKKGRTAVTSIAGSIGIISVCLVLALSNGFNNYIQKTQEDMLSSNPLKISRTTVDIDAIMSGMSASSDMPDLEKIGDNVYVNSFVTNMAKGMSVTNNLSSDYQKYVKDMNKEYYEVISTSTGAELTDYIYTEAQLGANNTTTPISLTTLQQQYILGANLNAMEMQSLYSFMALMGSSYGTIPGTTAEAKEDGTFAEYARSQYEIVEGTFPAKADEAVLVIGANNELSDLALAQLGLLTQQEFSTLLSVKDTDDLNTASVSLPEKVPFERILNKKYALSSHNDAYVEDSTGKYLYQYQGIRAALDAPNSQMITVTGIVRLKEGMNYGCLGTGGLYFTEQAVENFITANKSSNVTTALETAVQFASLSEGERESFVADANNADKVGYLTKKINEKLIAKTQSSQDTASMYKSTVAIGGTTYHVVDGAKAGELMQTIGSVDTVTDIFIYTDTFEAKQAVLDYLDEWNDAHEASDQVKYTDTIGIMMSMVEMMLNAITVVLVAFTAISLVVSSVMIGIITYVSVVERVKEIGVLRSLGARKRDIKNLFNAETFIIGLASGIFGVAVTYLLSLGINALLGALTGISTLAALPIGSAVVMVAISVGLTLISGLIPANAAAKKDPVVALRTE